MKITHLSPAVLNEMARRLSRNPSQPAKTLQRLLEDCCYRDGGRRLDPLPFDVQGRVNWHLMRKLAEELRDSPQPADGIRADLIDFIKLGDKNATEH